MRNINIKIPLHSCLTALLFISLDVNLEKVKLARVVQLFINFVMTPLLFFVVFQLFLN